MKIRTVAAAALAAVLPLIAARAQSQLPDVPPGHWAYQAVEELANAGLVLGYPDGRFLGGRTLTRYEMATLIKRLLDRMARPGEQPAPGNRTPTATPGQLAAVRRLINDFKVELTVIGTDLAAVKQRLTGLEGQVGDLRRDVTEAEKVNRTQQAAIDLINKKRIDGYIQARFTNRATDDPGRAPENASQDTTRGIAGNRDTFHVRRARFGVRGDITDRAAYRIELDARTRTAPTDTDEVRVKDAYVTIKGFPFRSASASGTPFLTMDMTVGQHKHRFGYLLPLSSSLRESPERYIAFSDTGSGLFPNQDRDRGLSFSGLVAGRYPYQLGIYNGNGTASNDLGRRKDFVARIGIPLIPARWNLGFSGYDGEGFTTGTPLAIDPSNSATFIGSDANRIAATRRRVKSLIGFDTQYLLPFGDLKIEYVRGKGGLSGATQNVVPSALRPYVDAATVEGYYAQLGYNLGARLKLVGAYEYFNRNRDPADSGPLSTFNGQPLSKGNFAEERAHIGALYLLDTATRLRLWFEAPLNYPNAPGGSESIRRTGFYTAEVQVKF